MVVVPALRHVALAARAHGTDSYRDVTHPSLYVRLPLDASGGAGEYLLVWTTTPWTLPANVAAAVQPDADVRRASQPDAGDYLVVARARRGGLRRDGRR